MVVTKEFVRAIYHAAEALRARAYELERAPEYSQDTSVGKTLRHSVEADRQRVAMLADWIERHRSEAGLTEEEVSS